MNNAPPRRGIFFYANLIRINMFWALLILIGILLLISVYKGAPPVPTSREELTKLAALEETKDTKKFVDLGSGDGRAVIAFARAGAEAHGYEINPLLVLVSRNKIKKAGIAKKAHIHWSSFWQKDLSEYDTVFVFGVSRIMADLAQKLEKELKPGSVVLSNLFPIPGWESRRKVGKVRLYIK